MFSVHFEKKAGLVRINIFCQMTDMTKKLRVGVTIFHSASLSFSERRRPVDANFGNDIGDCWDCWIYLGSPSTNKHQPSSQEEVLYRQLGDI